MGDFTRIFPSYVNSQLWCITDALSIIEPHLSVPTVWSQSDERAAGV